MNCKKIQELIMTDYIDNEINEGLYREIKQHLNTCNDCRQFEQVLQKEAVEPFKNAGIVKPPESVWLTIKNTILQEQSDNWFTRSRKRLIELFGIKKPVFAGIVVAAAVFIMIFFTRGTFNNHIMKNGYLEEETGFLAEFDIDGGVLLDEDTVDFGTAIEEFLM